MINILVRTVIVPLAREVIKASLGRALGNTAISKETSCLSKVKNCSIQSGSDISFHTVSVHSKQMEDTKLTKAETGQSPAPSTGVAILLGAFVGRALLLFAAPAIGGVVGTALFGWWGCAATSSGLAVLGGGSLAAGGAGMVGGTVLLTGAGATAGGVVANKIAKREANTKKS